MEIIPAVDIKGGRCVRLLEGLKDLETVYFEDPLKAAKMWEEKGAQVLHVVDLDAAFTGELKNIDIVAQIAAALGIPVEFGGGVRDMAAAETVFSKGVARVVIGTKGIEDPSFFKVLSEKYPGKIYAGLDAKGGRLALKGWVEGTEKQAADFAREIETLPLGGIIYTDITKDGTLKGPNFAETEAMVKTTKLPVIASGGVATVDDVKKLKTLGAAGCILGRALYTGDVRLEDAIREG